MSSIAYLAIKEPPYAFHLAPVNLLSGANLTWLVVRRETLWSAVVFLPLPSSGPSIPSSVQFLPQAHKSSACFRSTPGDGLQRVPEGCYSSARSPENDSRPKWSPGLAVSWALSASST